MNESVKLVVVLTIICLGGGILLAWVNDLTEAPIKAAAAIEKAEAIKEVLPKHDNDPNASVYSAVKEGVTNTFYVARKGGTYVGVAFSTVSKNGYNGDIEIMVGINADDKVQAIKILNQSDTPGLGAKIKEPKFTGQFRDKDVKTTKWMVKKDNGDLDAITAATISSRAVAEAIKAGLDLYLENINEIRTPGLE